MFTGTSDRRLVWRMVALVAVLGTLGSARSAGAANTFNYYLRAGVTTVPAGSYSVLPQLPAEDVLMWGYAACTDATFASCGAVTVPGPKLVASEGDTVNVYIQNQLAPPTSAPQMISEPTSLVVRGQDAVLDPVWVSVNSTGSVLAVSTTPDHCRPAGDTTSRVRSFTHETLPGAVGLYTWPKVKPGTYLYQSGTHPAVQVQMGLYGAFEVYPAASPITPAAPVLVGGQAYGDASSAFDREVTLVFSEIDPELHYSIASGRYGTPPPAAPAVPLRGQRTSTVDYRPRFFLINGQPASVAAPVVGKAAVGKRTLLRVLNAGLREKTPTLSSGNLSVIAEDGRPYSFVQAGVKEAAPRIQYSQLVAAGQTVDAIVTPSHVGNLVLFDRALNLSDGPLPDGGQRVTLVVAPALAVAAGFHPQLSGGDVHLTLASVSRPSWEVGTPHQVTWQPFHHAGPVSVELWKGPVRVREIAAHTEGSAGRLRFQVPSGLRAGEHYRLRIFAGDEESFTEFTVAPHGTARARGGE